MNSIIVHYQEIALKGKNRPWFLGRLDYGVPLDRRPGEARSRLYFSIGQAF
mgnify:CR=1 FL=1